MITFEEYENALKQRHGERIHNILSHSSVAIAGLGGLGSNIAMYLARARYEETLKNDPEFDENLDFVLFRDHGKAIARPYYYFKKLMKKCNIDCTKHVWHDLRHTYATLLDQNNMNMKVVSEILGHYSEEFTNEVYVIHKPEVIIYDTSEVMNSFIESLKLDSTERTIPVYDISFIQEYLF